MQFYENYKKFVSNVMILKIFDFIQFNTKKMFA